MTQNIINDKLDDIITAWVVNKFSKMHLKFRPFKGIYHGRFSIIVKSN